MAGAGQQSVLPAKSARHVACNRFEQNGASCPTCKETHMARPEQAGRDKGRGNVERVQDDVKSQSGRMADDPERMGKDRMNNEGGPTAKQYGDEDVRARNTGRPGNSSRR
jgi:hypothetical protein